MHLRSKLTSENKELRRKNRAKPSENAHFTTFYSKNHCIYWKTKNTNRFSIVKISVPKNFTCLR